MPSDTGFHFAEPLWLLLLAMPLLLRFLPAMRHRAQEEERLQRYADPHLLPHLLVQGRLGNERQHGLVWWKLIWSLGVLALAGPRWDYTDMDIYQPGYDVVVLLDVSRSMEVSDVKPSRIARARQEIEDLLRLKAGLRIGLIGYASVAHIVSPITDDAQTLRNLLPSLSPELVRLPGSRLSAALDRARRLLAAQPPGSSRHLLLISDGDFDEPGLETLVQQLHDSGIRFHALGIGTEQGGEVPLSPQGGILREPNTGNAVISRLDESLLRSLVRAGGGEYQRAVFQDDDTQALVRAIFSGGEAKAVESGHQRVWHERYYLLVALAMLLILPWFRRGRAAALQRL
ncbi:Ca-activated chloride channel homolog [Gammaproteobacteria bacterium]